LSAASFFASYQRSCLRLEREHVVVHAVLRQRDAALREAPLGRLERELERRGIAHEPIGLFEIDRRAAHAPGPPPGAPEPDGGQNDDDQQELQQCAHSEDHIVPTAR
jgi:hypothetical protein